MAEKTKDPARVQLKDVRLSFAELFRPKSFGDGEGDPQYSANFLMDPETRIGKTNIKIIEDAIEYVKKEKWPKGAPRLGAAKVCLRDGNDYDYDGYDGMMFVSANNRKKPLTLDRDKTEVVEEDGVLYSGCYVDAIVRVWAQDNKWGKRVNASVEAVRFRRDGDPFGASPVDPDEFDDLEDDEEDSGRSSRRRSRDEDDERPSRRRSRDEDDEDRGSSRRRSRDEDDEDRGSRRRSRDEEDEDRGSRRRSRDEDDEDRGSSRRRSRDDEGDDDGGSRRRRSRDEDDEDQDRPPRNSRARRSRDDDDI